MTAPDNHHGRQGLAAGTSIGAAILLMVLGIVSLLQGISAVAEDEVFVAGIDYIYEFDLTTWGWIHIVLGVLIIVCALALVTGTAWDRRAAVDPGQLPVAAVLPAVVGAAHRARRRRHLGRGHLASPAPR